MTSKQEPKSQSQLILIFVEAEHSTRKKRLLTILTALFYACLTLTRVFHFFSKLAFPHVHCSDNGNVTGFPYWSGEHGYGSHAVAGRMAAISKSESAVAAVAIPTHTSASTPRSRKKKKILANVHLPNEERDKLHVEMYKYLKWLHGVLSSKAAEGENTADSGVKKPKSGGTVAGVKLAALNQLTGAMESAFKVVRNSKAVPDAATDSTCALPFLEEALSEQLYDLVDTVKRDPGDPEAKPSRAKRNGGLVLNFEGE